MQCVGLGREHSHGKHRKDYCDTEEAEMARRMVGIRDCPPLLLLGSLGLCLGLPQAGRLCLRAQGALCFVVDLKSHTAVEESVKTVNVEFPWDFQCIFFIFDKQVV